MTLKDFEGKTIKEIKEGNDWCITFTDDTKIYLHGYENNQGDDCIIWCENPFDWC